ncbi:helix-turn-helix domain-containing protein [Paenibacillus sp. NPDC055715]
MQAFVSVAELRSLTEAAQKLNHLQSNMTAKIKKLEAHYGTALFYRKPRGMELTPAGFCYLKNRNHHGNRAIDPGRRARYCFCYRVPRQPVYSL